MSKERDSGEKTLFSPAEIAREFAEQYFLIYSKDEISHAALEKRQKMRDENKNRIELLCKVIKRRAMKISCDEGESLWKATLKKEPEKKGSGKEKHVFSIAQKCLLLEDIGLMRYLCDSSRFQDNEKIKELKKNTEEAGERNKEARRKLKCEEAEPWDLFDYYETSEEQRTLELILVMVEALFLEKFEPIDKEMFFSDLEIGSNKYGDEYTPEIIAAEKRLRNGVKAYVKRRTPKEDEGASK